MPTAIWMFAVTSFTPVPLLALAMTLGGVWTWAALIYITLAVALLDELAGAAAAHAPEADAREFPAADALSVLLAWSHFGLLAAGIVVLAQGERGLVQDLILFSALALFMGQVGNSNAHELIHRPNRWLRRLGRWVFISHLFGHHASAHPKVHHRFVATAEDPNSARLGQGFWHFAPRAWIGSYRAGLTAERAMIARGRDAPVPLRATPYIVYIGGGIMWCAIALALGGGAGLLWYLALASHATTQLLLSDYVQHYGLRRDRLPDGRYAPVSARHSWNAPHRASTLLMLNAPRHSDHHAHPDRAFPALRLPAPDTAPTLPRALPRMALLALVPRLWRREMDGRVRAWATPAERQVSAPTAAE
ncbi:MAG: alkane 1-monooxygenase [Celeribacter sp.]|jgi:alkane 1-monooxygenase